MDFKTYLCKRIKEFRENKKYTQEHMAKELGISTNHYGRIERGESSCTIERLIQICNVLQITPNDILAQLIISKDYSLEIELHKLNIEDKKLVSKLVEFLISKY